MNFDYEDLYDDFHHLWAAEERMRRNEVKPLISDSDVSLMLDFAAWEKELET